jgi:L-iditol 2-dehydrogenase
MVFHHIPCGDCYYCRHKVFAQCPTYKKVGATAGYEASGGGFSEYVRVMDWIVARNGVVRIPDGVSFEQASFIELVNTCMKGIETLGLKPTTSPAKRRSRACNMSCATCSIATATLRRPSFPGM